ncbi:MAG: hypothetical protein ACFFEN_10205 [Candidatus Thorarchaeota archaeon]
MKVQIGKMILYGVLTTLFYIVLPLVLFEVLTWLHLMTFTTGFRITIIIIGVIGVIFSMLRHLFPKDTPANRYVAFGATLYSGIYLFYMFGGFTPGVSYGTYEISLPTINVLLGLQLIAWTLLASSGIRALQYLIEAIELRKQKEYTLTEKRKFKLSKFFKVLGIILSLGILGYFGTLAYSGLNLGLNLHDSFGYNRDPGLNPDPDYSDDTISLTITFDVNNRGIYAIYNVYIDVSIYTVSSTNPIDLPVGVKIGEAVDSYQGTFHSFTFYPNNNVTVDINPLYAEGLITTDADLEFQIALSTRYAGILVDLTIFIQTVWNSIV